MENDSQVTVVADLMYSKASLNAGALGAGGAGGLGDQDPQPTWPARRSPPNW